MYSYKKYQIDSREIYGPKWIRLTVRYPVSDRVKRRNFENS